jgi:radical SAM superfamily enzyme YgiQ (UPF0313 family)
MSRRSPAIILTADETMMSKYRGGIFTGFTMCAPSGIMPDWMFFHAFGPPVPRKHGRALFADGGVRSIEAALLSHGFTEDEVAVVHPRDLSRMAGDETRIVSISGHDFLGINPPTSTFSDFVRTGPPYNRMKFFALMEHPVMRKVTTVAGGKSAWQLVPPHIRERLGIDHVHLGEGERSVPKAFAAILAGEEVPPIINGEEVPAAEIPTLVHATIHGLVECSRGCGRGCAFCTPTLQSLRHKPADQIIHDTEINARAGNRGSLLHAEDMLCYGGRPLNPDPGKLISLVKRVGKVEGITNIGFSHIALATVYHNRLLVEEISDYMNSLPEVPFLGAQTGIETGSPKLIAKHMRGKPAPSGPELWPDIVVESLGILHDLNWAIAGTMIVGLPGEEEEDVQASLELMDRIKGLRALVVPMNFVSMDPARLSESKSFSATQMTPARWQLFGACMEHDVQVAHGLSHTLTGGGIISLTIGRLAVHYLLKGAERYAVPLKEGHPPEGFDPQKKSYVVPDL